jgi:hypothetical protein
LLRKKFEDLREAGATSLNAAAFLMGFDSCRMRPMVHDLREDERELAGAILEGSKRRTDQAFGDYYRGRNSSCALGAAYEGIYRLLTQAVVRAVTFTVLPTTQGERIAAWFADPDVPQDESHAHH